MQNKTADSGCPEEALAPSSLDSAQWCPAQGGVPLFSASAGLNASLVEWTAQGTGIQRAEERERACERIPTAISVNVTGFGVKVHNNFMGHVCIEINRGGIQVVCGPHGLRQMLAGGEGLLL